jgi:ubiquinone/menaquinone biosynthesis C-methylase UbiE
MAHTSTHQESVAAYFESTVPRWEEFYCAHRVERPVYSLIYRSRLHRALALIDGLHSKPGSRCLDAGCGPGIASIALAQRGFLVDAIDIVPQLVERTRTRAAEARVSERISASVGDVNELQFPDGSFDVVVSIGVMEWQESPTRSLREMARVVRPGGCVILTVDNKWALRNILDPFQYAPVAAVKRESGKLLRRLGLQRGSSGPRDRSYSIRQFDGFLADAGLEKLQGETVGFGPFPFLDWELPTWLGLPLHRKLQHLADAKTPLLHAAGLVYITAAAKRQASKRQFQ